jgi:glycosyltransferase involved in cell wall biosynthesis
MSTSSSSSLVSVVVPTYNRGDCIERTIDSALGQTHQNLEILVVDDGSADDTRQRIELRYGADGRVRYFYQENRGVSAARNTGLQKVRGDFVALLDSDDVWMPWKLELQLACLDLMPDAGMIWTDMEAVGPGGETRNPRYLRTMYSAYQWFTFEQLFSRSCPLPPISARLPEHERGARVYAGDIFSQMIMGNLVHTSTVLIRRERLQQVHGFNEDLRHSGEDYDFHLRTCRAGPVAFVDVVSIKYLKGRADQLTQSDYTIHRARNFLRTITPILAQDRDRIHLPPHMIAFVLADAHSWIGEAALEIGENAEARKHLLQSLRYHPWQPRMTGLLMAALFPPQYSRRLRAAYRQAKKHLLGGDKARKS